MHPDGSTGRIPWLTNPFGNHVVIILAIWWTAGVTINPSNAGPTFVQTFQNNLKFIYFENPVMFIFIG